MSTIKISASSEWTITGPAWVTNLPLSGAGDYEFEPILSANGTGSYRTGNINIDYGVYGTQDIPIVQYVGGFIYAKIFILGLDDDFGQLVHYQVGANGTTLNDANTACGSSVDFSGVVETSVVPKNGATVTVKAYAEGYTNQSKQFQKTLNNAIYYLSSATLYDNGVDVITAGATAITTSYNGGTLSWDGSFTYAYVGDYFYIVFDYRNQVSCGGGAITVTTNGSYYPIYATVNYSTGIGVGSIAYTSTNADIIALATYNNNLIIDGSTAGTYKFLKPDTTPATLLIEFSGDENGWNSTITITSVCVSLRSTQISDASYATSALACAASGGVPAVAKWHDGGTTYPIVGDTIYTASNGSAKLNGNNLYWYLFGYAYSYVIDTNGVVQRITACVCGEVAVPVITTTTLYIDVNSPKIVKLTATLNPTSWALVSSYLYYTINGGIRGGNVRYTNEAGDIVIQTVGINETITIIAVTGTVSLDYGTITFASAGSYYQYGITIDSDGNLSGNFDREGFYNITANATNCFGVSANYVISIKVKHMLKLRDLLMDETGKATSVSACALTSCNTEFWFSSNLDETTTRVDPEINDIVFIDPYGEQYFNGGYLYYKTSNNNYLLIDGIGQVIDKNTC